MDDKYSDLLNFVIEHLKKAKEVSSANLLEFLLEVKSKGGVTKETPLQKSFDAFLGLKTPKSRGLVEGVFDLTHFGHFNAIRQARNLCDELVVAVNGDKEVCKHKGLRNKTNDIQRARAQRHDEGLSMGEGGSRDRGVRP